MGHGGHIGSGQGETREQKAPLLSGAVPATGFLRQSGIDLDSRGFIPVNKVGLGGAGRVVGWGPGGGCRPSWDAEPQPCPHR